MPIPFIGKGLTKKFDFNEVPQHGANFVFNHHLFIATFAERIVFYIYFKYWVKMFMKTPQCSSKVESSQLYPLKISHISTVFSFT
jgi:hypothetical protein